MVRCAKLGAELPGLPYKPFADALREGLKGRVADLVLSGARPLLAVVVASADPAVLRYAEAKRRSADALGIALEVVHLDGTGGQRALAGVSLTIRRGEFVAMIGQNGSGKTTLAKCLNGLLRPQRGTVRLRGADLAALPLNRVASDIGYVFQNPDNQIFAASVGEEVTFALRNFAAFMNR